MKGDPVAVNVRCEADPTRLAKDASQEPLSILERHLEEGPSIEVEQIECLVDEPRRWPVARATRSEPADRLLEQPEVGRPVLVERHDLAVDDRLARRDPRRRREKTREVGRA